MKKTSLILAFVLLGIAALAVYFFVGVKPADHGVDKSDLIRTTQPVSGQIVKSPLLITGEARGNWFFEASFPVKLLDANGQIIAAKPAQALSDWMTTDFVPFSLSLEFIAPKTNTGSLVLEKDNPSGLPEHADEIRIPIRFR